MAIFFNKILICNSYFCIILLKNVLYICTNDTRISASPFTKSHKDKIMGRLGRKALKKRQAIIRHIPDAAPCRLPYMSDDSARHMPRVRQRSPVPYQVPGKTFSARKSGMSNMSKLSHILALCDGAVVYKVHCPCRFGRRSTSTVPDSKRSSSHLYGNKRRLELHMGVQKKKGKRYDSAVVSKDVSEETKNTGKLSPRRKHRVHCKRDSVQYP